MSVDYVEKAISRALLADGELAAIIGNKVFPVLIPQNTAFPIICYQRISSVPDETLQGYQSEQVRIQLTVFTKKYNQAKELSNIIRRIMAVELCAYLEQESDLYDNETKTFQVAADYICRQSGGYSYGYD